MARMRRAVPVLAAVDVEKNARFWIDRLGFEGGVVADGFAIVRRDDIEVFISSVSDQIVPDNTMAWLRTDDIEALHADWSSRVPTDRSVDGTLITPITDQPWGREFVVIDPAGNCVHVTPAP